MQITKTKKLNNQKHLITHNPLLHLKTCFKELPKINDSFVRTCIYYFLAILSFILKL